MKYKYGEFTENQIHEYKTILHSKIHWLLIYQESNYPLLSQYFSSLQFHIAGLAELIDSPQIIELADLVECARMEYESEKFNRFKYRKLILDAHSIVDLLPEVGDENV